jgi:hypothetical protein
MKLKILAVNFVIVLLLLAMLCNVAAAAVCAAYGKLGMALFNFLMLGINWYGVKDLSEKRRVMKIAQKKKEGNEL